MISHPSPSAPEATRSRLRATLANMDLELACLTTWPSSAPDASLGRLRASLAELTLTLALGAEPMRRECPVCRHQGMRDAIRCGYCWSELVPPGAETRAPG